MISSYKAQTSVLLKSARILSYVTISLAGSFAYANEYSMAQNAHEPIKQAYKVSFSTTKFSVQRKEVFEYFKKDFDQINSDRLSDPEALKKFGLAKLGNIGIDMVDIDGDGDKEIFANPSAYPKFCWGSGCSVYVFKQNLKNKNIEELLQISGKASLYVGPEKVNGHSVIKAYDDVPKKHLTIWYWDTDSSTYIMDDTKSDS